MNTHADTEAFIIHHLVEVAKITHENVIGLGGTITAMAQALGHSGKFSTLEPHLSCGILDIATLAHMTIIDTKGGINKHPHHKQVLFTFPMRPKPTSAIKEIGIMRGSCFGRRCYQKRGMRRMRKIG